MNKKIILISGYCATGKTAFSTALAKNLSIPCFNKDYIKEVFAVDFEYENKEVNKKLSNVTFSMLEHIAERLMEANQPFVLESNFKGDEGKRLKQLIDQYGYTSLTYLFIGDLKVVHERFLKRNHSLERHPIHKSNELADFNDFESYLLPLGDFDIGGEKIWVDTTYFASMSYNSLMASAQKFFEK